VQNPWAIAGLRQACIIADDCRDGGSNVVSNW
jgi:hypothetical protein